MNVVMALNLKNVAPTQLADLEVNGLAVFNGNLVVASTGGLHTFKDKGEFGEDEEIESVSAFFELPRSVLGYDGPKSPRSLIVSGRISGALAIELTDEAGNTITYQTPVLDTYDGAKVALQSNQRSRYFQIKIKSVAGSYFSIDRVDMVFIPGPERRL